jgi:hypothetical protein
MGGEPAVESRDKRRVDDEIGASGTSQGLDRAGHQPEREWIGDGSVRCRQFPHETAGMIPRRG